MVYCDKRPAENLLDQAKMVRDVFTASRCDMGVGDLGYGAIQVKSIQQGGNDSRGVAYEGLGSSLFVGSRTIGNEQRPFLKYTEKPDEHGDEVGRFTIDKTTAIQSFIDMLETKIPHPTHSSTNTKMSRPKLMIPYHVDHEYETDWLINDFTDITRKDLSEVEDAESSNDPRTFARKEFNHPKDSTMSIIYAKMGLESNTEWNWISV